MKKLKWFYLIAALLGFCVDLGTLIAFFVEFGPPALGLRPTFRSWFAILSILTLFYAVFAFASWRYWIWLGVYAVRGAHFVKAAQEWRKNRKIWEKQEEERRARAEEELRSYRPIFAEFKPIYDVPPPYPPRSYRRSGVYLTIGLGILIYPLIAAWGLTFAQNIIWSTNDLEFALLLLVPFIFSGLGVLTAVITVEGFQYFVG